MATASDSPSAHVQSVNSVLDSRNESPERGGVPSLLDSFSPCSGISDQKHVLAPEIFLVAASFLAEDDQPEGSENDGVTEKRVWNKPANGVAPEVDAVMGSASWPALSKSACASTKASSTDSLEEVSHGSITLSKGMSVGSLSSQEFDNSIANSNFSQAPSSVVELSPFNSVKSSNSSAVSSSSAVSTRDNTHRDVGKRGSHIGHDPHHPRVPFRKNNRGPQHQENGSFNHSHGCKRDQERWKHDWSNNHRSFGTRVNLAPQQRPFIRGPVSNAPFTPPPPPVAMGPYGPPVFYNDTPSFMYYSPGPHPSSLGHIPMFPFAPMFYPIPDPHLTSKIVSQIDYYFSDDNLVKDTFLRQKMDMDGWVPINLIANFKKIRELTDNVQLMLDALRASNVVEIQGEKVRRKGNWRKWIMPTILDPTGSSPQSLNISGLHIHDERTDT